MSWKLHLAWPLCLALSAAGARSAPVDITETVYYDFIFEMASGGDLEQGLSFDPSDAEVEQLLREIREGKR